MSKFIELHQSSADLKVYVDIDKIATISEYPHYAGSTTTKIALTIGGVVEVNEHADKVKQMIEEAK